MADRRSIAIGPAGERVGTIPGRSPRGSTILADGYTSGALVPRSPPPPPSDLTDPRNSDLVGDLL